jgi:MFS family permease
MLIPLALAQFVASFAGSNMNVAINSIATDLGTTVSGVQVAITMFLLTMAALMIPGSKLSDIWGRKFCFILGLLIYGSGAVLASFAQGLGLLIIGYSLLEGVGSALMIPPIYILTTILFTDLNSRARSFGLISGMAGVGAAAGPLIGGLITTTVSWRASFIAQAIVVAVIIVLGRRISEPAAEGQKPRFDIVGAILSAVGLFLIVFGILQAADYGWFRAQQPVVIGNTTVIPVGGISPVWLLFAAGALILLWFFVHVRAQERQGKEPLLSVRLFDNRTSNLGLITQNIQWFTLMGISFVVSVYLQVVRGYSAIETGLIFTAATVGLLLSSVAAGRFARRRSQRTLVRAGFVITLGGMACILLLGGDNAGIINLIPGLFFIGVGAGVMMTPSVNIVQSSFPEDEQSEISGLSRSISNLGSSLGTAIAGTVLVSGVVSGNATYALALITIGVVAAIGLVAALLLPPDVLASHGDAEVQLDITETAA